MPASDDEPRHRLIRLLEETSRGLRDLATPRGLFAHEGPHLDELYVKSGDVCRNVEEICCELERRGHVGAAGELRRLHDSVLVASTNALLPAVCEEFPGLREDLSEHIEPFPEFSLTTQQASIEQCVGALLMMAAHVDGIIADLKRKGDTVVSAGGQGGDRANFHVENLIVGDQITAQGSTVVTHPDFKASSKIVGEDNSTNVVSGTVSKAKGARRIVAWLHNPIVGTVIGGLILTAILAWIGLG